MKVIYDCASVCVCAGNYVYDLTELCSCVVFVSIDELHCKAVTLQRVSDVHVDYVSGFERRGNFAQNAIFYHF